MLEILCGTFGNEMDVVAEVVTQDPSCATLPGWLSEPCHSIWKPLNRAAEGPSTQLKCQPDHQDRDRHRGRGQPTEAAVESGIAIREAHKVAASG